MITDTFRFSPLRRAATAILLMMITLLTGCGGGGGGSSTPAAAANPPLADFTVEQSSVAFGKTVVGQTVSSSIKLNNTGSSVVSVSLSSLSAPFTLAGNCSSIPANSDCTLTLRFAPTAQGDFSATLNLNATASNRSAARSVTLSGTGQGLDVQILSVANSCLDPVIARVSVSDANSTAVLNLQQNQFAARLANTGSALSATAITSFQQLSSQQPTAVGLIIDYSVSLNAQRPDVLDASRLFIEDLRDTDRAGLFKFAQRVDNNRQDFLTTDSAGRDALIAALGRTEDVGNRGISDIWGATNFVIERLKLETTPNRIAILITDGQNNTDTTALADLIRSAARSNIAVFVIAYGDVIVDPLRELADGTGGLLFVPSNTSNLTALYDSVREQLSNHYEVQVANAAPGPEKSLEIAVTNGSATGIDTKTVVACP